MQLRRGSATASRMAAHAAVLAAAAVTAAVAATLAAALAVFAGQALPRAVAHDLSRAPGTSLAVTALPSGSAPLAAGGAALRSAIAAALPGVPVSFNSATWSDPLELVPGALPAPPPGAAASGTPLLQAAALSSVAGHASLAAGRWPPAPARGAPVPAALPAAAAALLHVSVGDVLRLRDRVSGAPVSFTVTGVFTPRASGPYWQLDYIPAGGASYSSGTVTYGPLVVSPAAFGAALPSFSGSWVAQPDMAAMPDGGLAAAAGSVAALGQSLPNASFLGGAQLVTGFPSAVSGAADNLDVAMSTLAISALELLVLAVAALLAVARLLAAQQEAETALLTARGATRGQLAWRTAAEVIPLGVAAAAVGTVAGSWLASALAAAGPLGAAGSRLPVDAGSVSDAARAAAAVAVVAVATLLVPALSAGPGPGPGSVRARRGRQAVAAGVARAGLDVALLVLALLAGWQLRYYSAARSGGTGIDPVLALAPALAIAAGGVLTLRLLPPAARAADRLAGRSRRFAVSLASWQFARLPVRQGSAALLLTMAVATGALALAQHASWSRSVAEQSAFANGGDVQVDPPAPLRPGAVRSLAAARGVTHALPVAPVTDAAPGEVLALSARDAAQVVAIRRDPAPEPAASLFAALTPDGEPGAALTGPQQGAPPGAIALTATLGAAPGSVIGGLPGRLGPATVSLTVVDRWGTAFRAAAGPLAADGRPHALAAPLGAERDAYPLRVIGIALTFGIPAQGLQGQLALTVSGLPVSGWNARGSSPDLQTKPGWAAQVPHAGRPSPARAATTFGFTAGTGVVPGYHGQLLLQPALPQAVPAIATQSFLDANHLTVGDLVPVTMNGPQFTARITAAVPSFPAVTDPRGAVVVDLGTLQAYLAQQSFAPQPATQWWLATAGGGIPPGLAAALPAGTRATSAAALAAAAGGDVLSAAPQLALLAMAAAAALLAVTGFWTSIAADVRRRRGETALLAALGVTQRGAAGSLCLEKLLVGLPSAAAGLLLGTLLARLLVPAVTLSPAGRQPVPPVVMVYDLPQSVPFAVAVAAAPALIAAFAALRRPDPAAELRAAESA